MIRLCRLAHPLRPSIRTRRVVATSLSLVLAACSTNPTSPVTPQPPPPPVHDVTEVFYGTTVHDPYRDLEDTKTAATQSWMKAQSDYARATLARISGRDDILARLTRYDQATSGRVTLVARETGDVWFFERRGAQENQFKLYARRGLNGAESLLVDPEALEHSTGKPHAINYYAPSPGGALIAYGMSQQGSEAAVLHIQDARTGQLLGSPISRADYGAVNWSPDGTQLVFNRLQEMKPGMAPTEKFSRSQVWLTRPGEAVERAVPVFGIGVPGVEMAPAELPFVSLSHDGRWAFGLAINGTQREFTLYVAPQAGVLAGKPQWQRLFDASAEVTGVTYMADKAYLQSHRGASRFQVLELDLARPDWRNAKIVVPASERVITGIAAAADALYIEARDGNIKRLYKRGYAAGASIAEVPLPVTGSFTLNADDGGGAAADPRLPGLVLELQGWTRATQIYQVAADGMVSNTGLQSQGPYDAPADIVADEALVKSLDGAMVPMSIIHRKGVALDGRNPTLLYGYASYGITEEPFFSNSRLAWLDAGGVFAVANPRGSSVYGQEWYRAGYQATKPNTWKDFIACAQWLIAQGYTSPQRLAIWGGSAGGILVGRAMTERPDLFAVVLPQVGALDMVRAEVTPNGVPNIPEFGTRTTEAGFRSLLAMSTYHHVQDGVKYPAVLMTHGVNDPRVEVWESTKTAARLMAATSSGKPVLLRLDYDAGHGIGNTKKQQLEERADLFAFTLWQMGVPGYQLR
jgi:prolyl oligopeptidase